MARNGKFKASEKIKELEASGYVVNVDHWRYFNDDNKFSPRGGQTNIEIIDGISDKVVAKGCSICSEEDNYNKKLGLQIALGRALAHLS